MNFLQQKNPASIGSKQVNNKNLNCEKQENTSSSVAASSSAASSPLVFYINGEQHTVENPDPSMSLNDYIRRQPSLTGVKKCCGEAGCGVCTVMLTTSDGKKSSTVSCNSCVRPLCSMAGTNVTTVEGIGSTQNGLSDVQQEFVASNASQCGFCSDGWIVQMTSLLANNPNPTVQDIDKILDQNICRCTGYTNILAALHKFGSDFTTQDLIKTKLASLRGCCGATAVAGQKCCQKYPPTAASSSSSASPELEACSLGSKCCRSSPAPASERKLLSTPLLPDALAKYEPTANTYVFEKNGVSWYHATSLAEVFSLMQQNTDKRIMLVVGHTSVGVYKNQNPQVMIDIKDVPELLGTSMGVSSVSIGTAMSITSFMDFLTTVRTNNPSHETSTFPAVVEHLQHIASNQVRNVGSIGGNLMMANQWGFASDIATLLMGLGATVTVNTSASQTQQMNMTDFLASNMSGKVLSKVTIPYAEPNQTFHSYKITQRHVNAHAYVNAAILFQVDPTTGKVLSSPRLAFGGATYHAQRATNAENYLNGKTLTSNAPLQSALSQISAQIVPTTPGMHAYKRQLIMSLFYKAYLSVLPSLPASLKSATTGWYERPPASSTQTWKGVPDSSEYPVSQPVTKLEANIQVTGEAQYTADIQTASDSLYAAFVLSTQGNATLKSVDASDALKMPGVVDYLSYDDVKGANYIGPFDNESMPEKYQYTLFANKEITFCGQPIGLILADSYNHAQAAAAAVHVSYDNVQQPILTVEQAKAANSYWPAVGKFVTQPFGPLIRGDVETGFAQSDYVIEGSAQTSTQYHFAMETQTSIAVPQDSGGILLHAATQYTTYAQQAVARVLGIAQHKVQVEVKRIGGAFGSKITAPTPYACAAALAAQKHNRPVRFASDLSTNMQIAGKRPEFVCDYKLGFTASGQLKAVKARYYQNGGSWNDAAYTNLQAILGASDGCYFSPNFYADAVSCYTNLPGSTYCRAPGELPGSFFAEHMMEAIAHKVGKDPTEVKQLNFYQKGQITPGGQPLNYFSIPSIWTDLQQESNYQSRLAAVKTYNAQNRWTKRGIAQVPVKYGLLWSGEKFNALIDVYPDGSVNITHAGIESGQGINTKVAQVVAYKLGCDLSYINVSRSSTITSPNATVTGGSVTSELCSTAALDAAQQIFDKMKPIRALHPNASWPELVAKAWGSSLILQAVGWTNKPIGLPPFQYMSYGSAITEVYVDMLTGQTEILRSDVLFDAGTSLNPLLDVSSVQGAFIMGVGTYLTERLEFDETTGRLTTDGTWEYKPPSSMDVPIEFNVTLLPHAPNPKGFLSSKASGEPPYILSCSIFYAVKHALYEARKSNNNGQPVPYFDLNAPATIDVRLMNSGISSDQFSIN